MRPGGSHGGISAGAPDGVRRPVLVVKVDGAAAGEPTESCDVRMMGGSQEWPAEESLGPRGLSSGNEVTAVVILRDVAPSRVASCVRAATGGGGISHDALRQLLPGTRGRPGGRPGAPRLSDREHAVLRMLADGESTRGIAEQLSYSERTVKNIVRDLMIKLNCKTRAHAVALAAREGVI